MVDLDKPTEDRSKVVLGWQDGKIFRDATGNIVIHVTEAE